MFKYYILIGAPCILWFFLYNLNTNKAFNMKKVLKSISHFYWNYSFSICNKDQRYNEIDNGSLKDNEIGKKKEYKSKMQRANDNISDRHVDDLRRKGLQEGEKFKKKPDQTTAVSNNETYEDLSETGTIISSCVLGNN